MKAPKLSLASDFVSAEKKSELSFENRIRPDIDESFSMRRPPISLSLLFLDWILRQSEVLICELFQSFLLSSVNDSVRTKSLRD